MISRHAELIVEIAEAARDGLEHAIAVTSTGVLTARPRGERANGEHEADVVVNQACVGPSSAQTDRARSSS